MALVLLLAGAIILASESKINKPTLKGSIPINDPKDSWRTIIQKGQTIISEPFTSIGGYAIACDGRDFMYSPHVDQDVSDYQMENPQEMPMGI